MSITKQEILNKSLLHECKHGKLKDVKRLIKEGADLTYQDYSSILGATSWCNHPIVKYLLPLINDNKDVHKLIIKNALTQRNYRLIKWLIKNNVSIAFDNHYPMFYACKHGDIKSVNIFLQNGSGFHYNDYDCLSIACARGHTYIAKKILNHKPIREDYLRIAAKSIWADNRLNMLTLLAKYGLDLNFNDDTLLINACEYGRLNAVKYLISHKANVNTQNHSPLQLSALGGYDEITTFLLKKGANIDDAMACGSDKVKSALQIYYDKYLSTKDLQKAINQKTKNSNKVKLITKEVYKI